jgi:hypothetical protein
LAIAQYVRRDAPVHYRAGPLLQTSLDHAKGNSMNMIKTICELCRECAKGVTLGQKVQTRISMLTQESASAHKFDRQEMVTVLLPMETPRPPLLSQLDRIADGRIAAQIEQEDFRCVMDDRILVVLPDSVSLPQSVLVIGVGTSSNLVPMQLCCSLGRAVREAFESGVKRLTIDISACRLTNAAAAGHIMRCRLLKESSLASAVKLEEIAVLCAEADTELFAQGAVRKTPVCAECALPDEE